MPLNAHLLTGYRVAKSGGFVCIDIGSCYHTLVKYMLADVLWVEVTTPKIISKINDMVLSNRRTKVREIVKITGISQGTVFSILHEKLGVKKISARCVLHLLSEKNKRNRVVDSEAILAFSVAICD